jgi:hypothetical protein
MKLGDLKKALYDALATIGLFTVLICLFNNVRGGF